MASPLSKGKLLKPVHLNQVNQCNNNNNKLASVLEKGSGFYKMEKNEDHVALPLDRTAEHGLQQDHGHYQHKSSSNAQQTKSGMKSMPLDSSPSRADDDIARSSNSKTKVRNAHLAISSHAGTNP